MAVVHAEVTGIITITVEDIMAEEDGTCRTWNRKLL